MAAGRPELVLASASPRRIELLAQVGITPDHIDPADIDNLRVGLDTEVKFPGLRERNPPIVHGRVTRISADSFNDEKTGRSHYRAEIVVPPSELQKLGGAARTIRAGMPVQVVILTRKRTMLTYLVEPLIQSLWRSGAEQ